jgi:hypothetical protein
MSEAWLMVIAVVALGLGVVNTLTLIAYGAGLAGRIEAWREEQGAMLRVVMAVQQDILQRLERVERLQRGEPVWEVERVEPGESGQEAKG